MVVVNTNVVERDNSLHFIYCISLERRFFLDMNCLQILNAKQSKTFILSDCILVNIVKWRNCTNLPEIRKKSSTSDAIQFSMGNWDCVSIPVSSAHCI